MLSMLLFRRKPGLLPLSSKLLVSEAFLCSAISPFKFSTKRNSFSILSPTFSSLEKNTGQVSFKTLPKKNQEEYSLETFLDDCISQVPGDWLVLKVVWVNFFHPEWLAGFDLIKVVGQGQHEVIWAGNHEKYLHEESLQNEVLHVVDEMNLCLQLMVLCITCKVL